MNRRLVPAAALGVLIAMPLAAQQQPARAMQAVSAGSPIVASINGEVLTREKLDQLYNRLGAQMRTQYEKTGGKTAFLENYLRKRLLVQEAIKGSFDKRPDVQADLEAAKESALFDRYVRDVISAPIVTEGEVKKYYDEHKDEFAIPERVKVHHIVVVPNGAGPRPKTKDQAMEMIQAIASELRSKNTFPKDANAGTIDHLVLAHFEQAARRYSEDGSAGAGGDLGWVERGALDPKFEEVAFGLKKGSTSGIVETRFGYHLILVEDRKPKSTEPFETAKVSIHEYLMTQHAADVVQAVSKLTNELRASSRISLYPENLQ